jgi:hypothetical protein
MPQGGDGNEKQTKSDQEGSKNRARDAYISKLAFKQSDASDNNKHQPQNQNAMRKRRSALLFGGNGLRRLMNFLGCLLRSRALFPRASGLGMRLQPLWWIKQRIYPE